MIESFAWKGASIPGCRQTRSSGHSVCLVLHHDGQAWHGVRPLSLAVEAEVGYASTVILPATHDTGSAYMTIARDFKVTLRESFLD